MMRSYNNIVYSQKQCAFTVFLSPQPIICKLYLAKIRKMWYNVIIKYFYHSKFALKKRHFQCDASDAHFDALFRRDYVDHTENASFSATKTPQMYLKTRQVAVRFKSGNNIAISAKPFSSPWGKNLYPRFARIKKKKYSKIKDLVLFEQGLFSFLFPSPLPLFRRSFPLFSLSQKRKKRRREEGEKPCISYLLPSHFSF